MVVSPNFEKAIFTWFKEERSENKIVNYRSLRTKATEIIDDPSFKGSCHWIVRFMSRHKITM